MKIEELGFSKVLLLGFSINFANFTIKSIRSSKFRKAPQESRVSEAKTNQTRAKKKSKTENLRRKKGKSEEPWQCKWCSRAGSSSYPRTRPCFLCKARRSSAPPSPRAPPPREEASPESPNSCSWLLLLPPPSSRLSVSLCLCKNPNWRLNLTLH